MKLVSSSLFIICLVMSLRAILISPTQAEYIWHSQAEFTSISRTGSETILLSPSQQAATPTPGTGFLASLRDNNAGLICGASLLVLIVIGGIIWTSRQQKR